jgi:phage terminase small subunit
MGDLAMEATPKLTRKQSAFVQYLLENPKDSATKAAIAAYNVTTPHSAEVMAQENMRKPAIMAVLADHAIEAENTVVEFMKQRDDKRLAFDASRDLLDRTHGKATQRMEVQSTAVSITIDLTGMSLDNSVIDSP